MKKLVLFPLIAIMPLFLFVLTSEARMYSPSQGRFMEPDPIGQAGGVNPYVYTENNPVNLVDPLGLDPAGPYPGSTNPVTRCHVCPHNDPKENAIGGFFVGAPLVGMLGTSAGAYTAYNFVLSPGTAIVTGEIAGGLAGQTGNSSWPSPGNGRAVVNGIEYTEHALTRMAPKGLCQEGNLIYSRGIPPSVVKNAITNGAKSPGNEPGTVAHIFDNIFVVTDITGKRIITVRQIRQR